VREPSLKDVGRQTRRLFYRARRLWPQVLAAVLFVTLGAVGFIARKPVIHEVKIIVRVTEVMDNPALRTAWTNRDLRGSVTEVAFSHENLVGLMKRLGMLTPRPGKRLDPNVEVEEFREDISVEVVQNQVISLLAPQDRPRSARVIIRYRSTDREEAFAVTRALAGFVVSTSGAERRRELTELLRQQEAAVAAAKARVEELLVEGTRTARAGMGAAEAMVVRERIDKDLLAARRRVLEFETQRDETRRLVQAERQARGMEVEVIEPTLPPPPLGKPMRMLLVGLATLLLGTPLCALLVGAFSRKIYTAEDLEPLGLPCLGLLPVEPYAAGQGGRGEGRRGAGARRV
jgi:hypothetical protein